MQLEPAQEQQMALEGGTGPVRKQIWQQQDDRTAQIEYNIF